MDLVWQRKLLDFMKCTQKLLIPESVCYRARFRYAIYHVLHHHA